MVPRKSVIRTLFLIKLTFLNNGCGDASSSANLAARFPGAVSSALPGAEIISQEAFNRYLQSGQLAPYKANTPRSTRQNGSGPLLGNRQEFESAGRLGGDILLVSDYMANHRGSQEFKKSFTDPAGIIEIVDENGQTKNFQVADNSYRIISVASSIRRGQGKESLESDQSQNVSKSGPPGVLSLPRMRHPLVKRGLASTNESLETPSFLSTTSASSVPSIRCLASELGHGISSDEGSVTGDIKPPYRAYSDGLISNFDWPLKTLASCVKHQGIRGSCTAFSVIGAIEILIGQKYNLVINLSEQALYFRGKGFLDSYSPDSDGFSAQLYLEEFERNGSYRVSYEKDWNYNLSSERKSQSDFTKSCSADYKEFCSNSPGQGRLYCTNPTADPIQCGYLSQIKSLTVGAKVVDFDSFLDMSNAASSLQKAIGYLKDGIPVVLEATLTRGFYAPYHGYVPEPTANDKTVGGHSMLVVGYISESNLQTSLPSRVVTGNGGFFIVKNSWGPGIGDAGYFYVSFKYLEKYAYSLFAILNVSLAQ